MTRLRVFLFISFVLFISSMYGQKGVLKQANKYFKAEKYDEALKLYNQLDREKLDAQILFRRGVSNYFNNNMDQSIRDLTNARNLGYDESEIYYYAARSYHMINRFEDATRFYKNYLRYLDDDKAQRMVIEQIKRCKFGVDNQYNDQIAFIENLGQSVNTEYDEYCPVQSPTSSNKFYFSSNRSGSHGGLRNSEGYKDEIYGNYYADMYAVELSGGNWTPVSAFHPILNGPKNDIIQSFNPDGSVMYFLKSQDGITGQMYSDTFAIDKDPEAFPKIFESPVISELGDKDLQVFNNNTLIFSSKRKGGYGGYDLYISIMKDGTWEKPINLGPKINSPYDEVDPFLTRSGTKLYFSTNRIESFGGFDIYAVDYLTESRRWTTPVNLGFPINSAGNDRSFSVSSDGMTAILSSDRPDSEGGSDLYLAYFKDQVTEQLMYTEEVSFLLIQKDSVSLAELVNDNGEVLEDVNGDNMAKKEFLNSPLFYGSDEIIMNPVNTSIMKRVKDLMIIYPELHITFSGHSTQEGMKEFDLYFSIKRAEKAAEYLMQNGISPDRIAVKGLGSNFPNTLKTGNQINRLASKNSRRIDMAFNSVPKDKLTIINDASSVNEGFRDATYYNYISTIKDLAYKVKVARTKQMYKADVIREYQTGIVEKGMNEDSYTYTIGVFDTYNEARTLKRELIRKGILDAKVVPYINDRPINIAQSELLKELYPDLIDFIQYESE